VTDERQTDDSHANSSAVT